MTVYLRNIREQYDYVQKHIKQGDGSFRLTTGFMSLLNTTVCTGLAYWAVR